MEICDNLRKSVLKKPHSSSKNKGRKVTFCGTVKLFTDNPNCAKKKNKTDHLSDCVEISIVDKSSNELTATKIDDCTANDFLVHKVIYEDELDHDTDNFSEEADDGSILFDVSNEEEGLQFIVHKVIDHEDDLIQQELDLDDVDESLHRLVTDDDVVGKLSELSIENILTHDKIIAFIDQKSLGLASLLRKHVKLAEIDSLSNLKNTTINDTIESPRVSSSIKNSELVLSPPLQELSLDKIVKAQSDNVLCELDISPLNSIQETDSDSDISSEGTMIMMTTEESEKNEQHIRESFLKYQCLIKEKSQTKDSEGEEKSIDNPIQSTGAAESVQNSSATSNTKVKNPSNDTCSNPQLDTAQEDSAIELDDSFIEEPVSKNVRSASLPNNSNIHPDQDFCSRKGRRESFNSIKPTGYWEKALESVEIPKDVREWKITPIEKNPKENYRKESLSLPPSYEQYLASKSNSTYCISKHSASNPNSTYSISNPNSTYSISNPNSTYNISSPNSTYSISNTNSTHSMSYTNSKHKIPIPTSSYEANEQMLSPKSDELESFVYASTERVQRIRRRYLEKPQKKLPPMSSVRGVRPRFCSTAEILRMLEKKNQPPFITFGHRNHVSWPCNETVNNSDIHIQTRDQFSRMFGCQVIPGEYSLQNSFSSHVSEDSNSSTCDHDSVSSCPSIFFHERGVPEGASPPRSLSNDSIEEKYTNEENPSNIVYFSMKV